MGKSSRRKNARRKLQVDFSANVPTNKVPSENDSLLMRIKASIVHLRGNDVKEKLKSGEILVTCENYAVIPLEQYRDLLALGMNRKHTAEQEYERRIAAKRRREFTNAANSVLLRPGPVRMKDFKAVNEPTDNPEKKNDATNQK